jgi:hypothetical protein
MMSDRRSSRNVQGKWNVSGLTFLSAILFTVAMFFLSAGCQSINPLPSFGVGQASPEESRIQKLMKWHSGRTEVYREFRTVFTARAVYLSEDIQRSIVEFESRTKLMNPDERTELEEQLAGTEGTFKILLGFYTPNEDFNDLVSETSVWTPHLKSTDGTVTRASCFSVDEDVTKIYMRFLEWDLSWSRLYMLCFPYDADVHKPDDRQIELVISGSKGRGEILLNTTPPGDIP